METTTKLYLSEDDYKIAGVCGGIAEHFKMNSMVVRLAFILVGLVTAVIPIIIFYFIAWGVIPRRPEDLPERT